MSARRFAVSCGALLLCSCAASSQGGRPASRMSEDQLVAHARGIHERALTIDTHDDIPGNFATPEVDPGVRGNRQVDLVKMREGGLDVAFFAVFVGQGARTPEGNADAKAAAMMKFDAIHRLAERMHPDKIGLAYTPDDVIRINRSGKLVAAIGIENGYAIGRDISLVKTYFGLGSRYMTLAHTANNDISDSSTDPKGPEHNGLSAFGEQVVREMNRVGMMVDVSHISKAAMLHAIRISKAPVIGSHSSTGALANVPRNMDDDQLRALAKNGGVMQTVAFSGYVKVAPLEKTAAIAALRQELGFGGGRGGPQPTAEQRAVLNRRMAEIDAKWPRPTVKDFVDHIDHAVKLIGIDHVGISSDFDGGGGVTGWNDASETFNVTLELVRRGYSEKQIQQMWSGNVLRVWRDNARVAADLQRATMP